MQSMKRLFQLFLWLESVAVGAAACRGGEAARGEPPRAPQAGRRLPVAVQPVARRDLSRTVTVAGPVQPVRTIGVNSQTAGTVLEVRVQEGDRVEAGALLARLDAREAEAQLARARATLEGAVAAFRRDSALHAGTIVTAAEFERSRAAYQVAESEVALWETRRAFTRITAPSAGVVTVKLVEAGSAVTPNQRMFDLADVSLLVVRVQVSELDVVHLGARAPVTVRLDAFPTARIDGWVRRVFPSADPQSRLVPVEVALGPRPRALDLKPGFLARIEFGLERRAGVLATPAAAVGIGSTGPFVYVVADDTLAIRGVELGLTTEGWVEVRAGLAEGERVVVSGHSNLRPGAPVQVSGAP
jgi:RND family efflux transporter MFP subunit